MSPFLLLTKRLTIRKANAESPDIDLILDLWTDPRVMTPVGFPNGLSMSKEEVRELVAKKSESVLSALLIVEVADDSTPIGHCKLGAPDEHGVSETDIKLLPAFWNQGF